MNARRLEQQIDEVWDAADRDRPDATVRSFENLLSKNPSDARCLFELASAYDWVSREAEAIPHYEAAIAAGLDADHDRRARIQLGSSLRNVGRADEAVTVLRATLADHPDSAAARCFLALALIDAGSSRDATAVAIDAATMGRGTDVDEYRAPLQRYTDQIH